MADANIPQVLIDTPRHRIAVEAAYEIEFLSESIRKVAKDAGDQIDIAIRGLAVRVNDLSLIISQALFDGEGATQTDDLSMALRGESINTQEASHV